MMYMRGIIINERIHSYIIGGAYTYDTDIRCSNRNIDRSQIIRCYLKFA